jgi:hypothetical protein
MRKKKRGKEDGELGVEIALNPPRKIPKGKVCLVQTELQGGAGVVSHVIRSLPVPPSNPTKQQTFKLFNSRKRTARRTKIRTQQL